MSENIIDTNKKKTVKQLVTALIPARGGSKRVPNKNFRELNGRPLIEYSIIAAQACHEIDQVVVTSDCCPWVYSKYGVTYLDRPAELCTDDAADFDVIAHAVKELDLTGLIAYLRPTTPFRADYHLCEAIRLMQNTVALGLRSVEEMGESAFKCFTMDGPCLIPIYDGGDDNTDQPNDLVTKTYHPNGYIDICRAEKIKHGYLWGNRFNPPYGYLTPRTIEIDTPEDFEYAQWWAQRYKEAVFQFGMEQINKGDNL